jgi:hypothetical protein
MISTVIVWFSGNVYANYSITSVVFQIGKTESYELGEVPAADVKAGGSFIIVGTGLTPLIPGTLYHYRVRAINSYGTAYGDDVTFTTLSQ